jgi:hypothetical protein
MSRNVAGQDVSALLYLVPFAASGVYGVILWVQSGLSATLPSNVYLSVTRDPILFALGSIAVMLGLVLDVRSTEPGSRPTKVVSLANTLQSMAAASLVLALVSALYANGFDVGAAAGDFIVGRYGLVFPATLVLLSYLVSAQFKLESLKNPKTIGIIALLLVPVSIYEIGKRQTFIGLLVAFLLLLIGVAPYLMPAKRKPAPVQPASEA